MDNFRRRTLGEVKLVSTTYEISSVSNTDIVIINPNNQLIISSGASGGYTRGHNNYTLNPYICVTCDVKFIKKETYSDASVKTSTINASFTYTGTSVSYGAIPGYNVNSKNGNITTWSSLSGSILSSSLSGDDRMKCTIEVNLSAGGGTIINTSSPVGTVGSGSFSVSINGNPLFISNYRTKYSCGVVNTTLTKISDTTFSEALST